MGFLKFLIHIREAYSQRQEQQRRHQEKELLNAGLRGRGFEWRLGTPAFDVGTALVMAQEYNVRFGIGTSYSQCRADIHKEDWQNSIHPNIKSGRFGSFFEDKPHEDIESVYGYGFDIQDAICRCLINARIAGVI